MSSFQPIVLRVLAAILAFAFCTAPTARAQIIYEVVKEFAAPGLINPRRTLTVLPDRTIYGTTQAGGSFSSGGIFKIASAGAYSEPVVFQGQGGTPSGSTVQSELTPDGSGLLWGTTFGGGTANAGTIFKFNPATGTAVTVAEFTGGTTGNNRGGSPFYGLTYDGSGTFYGTTKFNGANGSGVLFSITTAGVLNALVDFTGTAGAAPGAIPECLLTRDALGRLYGTTNTKSTGNKGTVYRFDPADNSIVRLVDFGAFAGFTHGANPLAGVVLGSDGLYYGCARFGGASNNGVIYKMATDGTITNLVDLTGIVGDKLGSEPIAALLPETTTTFLGVASKGGTAGHGVLFRIALDGTYTVLLEFTGTTGGVLGDQPFGGLVKSPDGHFYGTTFGGGGGDFGVVFRFFFSGQPIVTTAATAITPTTATLNAQVNPAGLATTVEFFLNGTSVGTVSAGSGSSTTAVAKNVTGLTPLTEYTVTATAKNTSATSDGGAVTFTTTSFTPVANPDSYELPVTNSMPTSNDVDPSGGGLTITALGAPAHGTATLPSVNHVAYTPDATFTGTDSFSYTIKDNTNATASSTITVRDTIPPVFTAVPGPQTINADASGFATLPDYTPQVTATDNSFIKSITQSPAPGTALPIGTTVVTFTATDAAGLKKTAQINVSVPAALIVAKATGDAVASVPGLTWAAFRNPALNINGDLAFAATLAGPGVGKTNKNAVFLAPSAGAPAADVLIARQGDPAPDAGAAKFAKFSDAVVNTAGHVAFLGKLKGGAASGVFATGPSGLRARALAGGSVSGSTAKIGSILALALDDSDRLAMLVTLGRTAAIVLSPDTFIGPVKIAAVGDTLSTSAGAKKVKALAFLPKSKGVYPQTRGLNANGTVAFSAKFTDGTSGIFTASVGGTIVTFANPALSGTAVPTTPAGALWAGFGQPLLRPAADTLAFTASLAVGPGGITAANATGLFADASLARLLATGDAAPDVPGAFFAKFSDVLSPQSGALAFLGTLRKGAGGVSAKTLNGFWAQPAGGALRLLARQGFQPPGVFAGQVLGKFRAAALPADGRAIFCGQLKIGHGVKPKNDVGMWAVDQTGALQIIAREGNLLTVNGNPQLITLLDFLPAVPTVAAQTRGFNANGQLTFRAVFKDRSQALFRVNR